MTDLIQYPLLETYDDVMASVLAEIFQISALLYTTDNSPSRSPVKATTTMATPLLPVLFPDFNLSNDTESSKSDLPIAASAGLDISIEALNSSMSLLLEIFILAFSPPTHVFSLPSKSFFFLDFYLFVSLADQSSTVLASPIFAFFLQNPISVPVLNPAPKFPLVVIPIFRCPRLKSHHSTPMFLPAFSSSSANSLPKSFSHLCHKKTQSKSLAPSLSSKSL